MIKLFVSDLDGTLLPDTKIITPLAIKTIKELKKQGKLFVIATGRPYALYIKQLIKKLELKDNDYIIVFNGAMIYQGDNLIYSCPLTMDNIKEILSFIKDYDVNSHVFTSKSKMYIDKENQYSTFVANTNNITPIYQNYYTIDDDIIKFSIVGEDDVIQKVIDNIPQDFYHRYNIFRSYPFLLEIVNKKVDKYEAVKYLASKLKINNDEIMAFGDEENDYQMVKNVGYGITPINGRDKLKTVAKEVCESCNDDGVIKRIIQYLDSEEK